MQNDEASCHVDIMEIVIDGRVYLTTRGLFEEFTDLSAMLEAVIRGGAQSSVIHHIFDDCVSSNAVGERFVSWQTAMSKKFFVVGCPSHSH